MPRFLSSSRYFILIAVLGSFGCACLLLGYGASEVFALVKGTLSGELKNKILLLDSIEAIDTFLLATLCYVVSLGLYELFIDDSIPLPQWLHITSRDDRRFVSGPNRNLGRSARFGKLRFFDCRCHRGAHVLHAKKVDLNLFISNVQDASTTLT